MLISYLKGVDKVLSFKKIYFINFLSTVNFDVFDKIFNKFVNKFFSLREIKKLVINRFKFLNNSSNI